MLAGHVLQPALASVKGVGWVWEEREEVGERPVAHTTGRRICVCGMVTSAWG